MLSICDALTCSQSFALRVQHPLPIMPGFRIHTSRQRTDKCRITTRSPHPRLYGYWLRLWEKNNNSSPQGKPPIRPNQGIKESDKKATQGITSTRDTTKPFTKFNRNIEMLIDESAEEDGIEGPTIRNLSSVPTLNPTQSSCSLLNQGATLLRNVRIPSKSSASKRRPKQTTDKFPKSARTVETPGQTTGLKATSYRNTPHQPLLVPRPSWCMSPAEEAAHEAKQQEKLHRQREQLRDAEIRGDEPLLTTDSEAIFPTSLPTHSERHRTNISLQRALIERHPRRIDRKQREIKAFFPQQQRNKGKF